MVIFISPVLFWPEAFDGGSNSLTPSRFSDDPVRYLFRGLRNGKHPSHYSNSSCRHLAWLFESHPLSLNEEDSAWERPDHLSLLSLSLRFVARSNRISLRTPRIFNCWPWCLCPVDHSLWTQASEPDLAQKTHPAKTVRDALLLPPLILSSMPPSVRSSVRSAGLNFGSFVCTKQMRFATWRAGSPLLHTQCTMTYND